MDILFNDSWRFLKTDADFSLEEAEKAASGFFDLDKEFKPVEIPHDWLIWDTQNLYETGTGWYVKDFQLSEMTEHAFFRFDGVYMDSEVFINGQKAFEWKYGYSTFTFEATKYLVYGMNRIIVCVHHVSPNTRWYSGAGIYRDVHFITKNQAYLVCDGSYVHTTELSDGDYKIEIETEVFKGNTDCMPVYSLWKEGALVANLGAGIEYGNARDIFIKRQKNNIEKIGESGLTEFSLPDFNEFRDITLFKAEAVVEAPLRWDTDSPNLYSLHVALVPKKRLFDDERIDGEHIKIGFKSVVFDTEKGFFLNGRNMKIKGVCEHHDLGLLGAAFDIDALRRKFNILKKMGVNSIRTSHNMPAPQLFDLCDEMGLLVDCEAFDMWEMPKTEFDYARFFPKWSYKDVASWVRRDRNRASIIMWSLGNEIPDTNCEHGVPITKHLTTQVLNYDPYKNAHVTIGSNFMPWDGAQACAEIVKLAGYNYTEKLYEEHHKKHPDYVIYGSETSSIVSSRGVYHFPASEITMSEDDEQCSSLGNSAVSWGAKSIEALVYVDRDISFSMGQYLWTGTDYIGEPTPYQTKNSYFGQVDTAGFPKDDYYCLMAEWTRQEDNPFVHLYPYWNWNEGQLIDMRACTTGDMVELFLNGRSLGKKYIDHEKGKELFPIWQVPYEPGEIKAVAYDIRGNVIAKHIRHSFGEAKYPVLTAEGNVRYMVSQRKPDGTKRSIITIYPEKKNELIFVDITACDEEGYTVENAMDYVELTVTGGKLLGMDNGDSTDYDSYKGNIRKLFNGKLMAMVRAESTGEITVEAKLTKGFGGRVPVRAIKLTSDKPLVFKPGCEKIRVNATVLPENATDKEIRLTAVNSSGIEVDFLSVSDLKKEEDGSWTAEITALGDGCGYIRATSKSGTDKIKIISCIEYTSEGFGYHFVNPYKYVSCGLFDRVIGDVGAGNDKGVSTEENAYSGAVYRNIDFGEFGSDEMTIDLFTFSDSVYHIDMYLGEPDNGGELFTTLDYKKPCIWNQYQPETYKLPKRLKGLKTVAFMANCKLHIKGFLFTKQEKAFSRINASDYDSILGDSFKVGETAVTDIGNNVVLGFDNMDFGEKGTKKLVIFGKTPLDTMTIRMKFTGDGVDNTQNYAISGCNEVHEIALEKLCGKGKIEFIFLPGTRFDFFGFEFKA